MGYQSNVRMVIEAPRDLILAELASARLVDTGRAKECLEELVVVAIPKDGDDDIELAAIVLRGNGWKWYLSYADVQWFENLWTRFAELCEEVDSHDGGNFIRGGFVRIGEETADIEERSFGEDGWELVSVQRMIDCSYEYAQSTDDIRPSCKA